GVLQTGVLPHGLGAGGPATPAVLVGQGCGFFRVIGSLVNVPAFIFKCWLLMFGMMWVRWTRPRLRIDQEMMTSVNDLLPIGCVMVMGVSAWQSFLVHPIQGIVWWAIFGVCIVLLAMMVWRVWTWTSLPPGAGMPGMWRMTDALGYHGARRTTEAAK